MTLSPRQTKMLEMALHGLCNKEIASESPWGQFYGRSGFPHQKYSILGHPLLLNRLWLLSGGYFQSTMIRNLKARSTALVGMEPSGDHARAYRFA